MLSNLNGQHLIVNDYGGENTSFFLDKYERRSHIKIVNSKENKNVGLDFTDLNNLMYLDTLIIENLHGDIRFANGLLKLKPSKTHLIIKAKGNVLFSSHSEYIASSTVEIESAGTVFINGTGYKNASGLLKINSRNLEIANDGIQQRDGLFLACILDTLNISGLGIINENTDLIIEASYVKLKESGITSTNLVDISNGRDIHIEGNGINTRKLHISSQSLHIQETGIRIKNGQSNINAKSININGNGINSIQSYLSISNFDTLSIKGSGITANESQFVIKNGIVTNLNDNGIIATKTEVTLSEIEYLEINDSGILLNKSPLTISLIGSLDINGEGIYSDTEPLNFSADVVNVATKPTGGSGIRTKHADININFGKQITVSSNGISSLNGSITLDGTGDVSVKYGGIFTTDSNILVRSKKGHITLGGYNLNTAHNTNSKVGVLDTFKIDQSRLTLLTEPAVGAGNVAIKTN